MKKILSFLKINKIMNIFMEDGVRATWKRTDITIGDFRLLILGDDRGGVLAEYWEEIH
jgi:hypothetical protein